MTCLIHYMQTSVEQTLHYHFKVAIYTDLRSAILYLIFIRFSLSYVTWSFSIYLPSEPPTLIVDSWNNLSIVLFYRSLFIVTLPELVIWNVFLGVTNDGGLFYFWVLIFYSLISCSISYAFISSLNIYFYEHLIC